MDILRDMIRYWRKPEFTAQRTPMTVPAIKEGFMLLAFSLGAVFALMIVTGAIFQMLGMSRPNTSQDFNDAMSKPYFILIAVILAPLIEEVLFRSWLGTKWGVLLVLPILLWGLAVVVFLSEKSLSFQTDVLIMIGLTGLVGAYALQYCRSASIEGRHERVLMALFPFVFWGSTIVFGLIHLTNFESHDLGVLGIIIVLPQIFVGAVLGFLRMRYGLLGAILFHGAYNGVLVGLSLLALRSVSGG